MAAQFKLMDYAEEMRTAMRDNNWTAANTVKRFITNLAALRPIYAGWDTIAFNVVGQQWNRLKYKERNDQQAEMVQLLEGRRYR